MANGRPNACNLCHLDKTLAWTAQQLAQWYRQDIPAMPTATEIAHAVRLALSGDAGSVSLLAWHLLAARVAGLGHQLDHTVPGQLLDDPYAAVRCVAERLLRAISNLVPPGYDYVVDSRFRPPARDQVWAAWQHDLRDIQAFKPLSQGILIRPDDLTAQRASFALWLRQRNDRPLRLRE